MFIPGQLYHLLNISQIIGIYLLKKTDSICDYKAVEWLGRSDFDRYGIYIGKKYVDYASAIEIEHIFLVGKEYYGVTNSQKLYDKNLINLVDL